jgi:predicted naringenin-chalcone synthase
VPTYCHQQMDILHFMQRVYAGNEADKRKIKFLYSQSGIQQRHSFISDYSKPIQDWKFYSQTENLEPFPTLEQRMEVFQKKAPALSVDAIRSCLNHKHHPKDITHLITVSCTGMSAPGLDLQVMDLMDFQKNIFRTSINFMGCYAAIHALKLADVICRSEEKAQVVIVCTELCTLHFQREATMDNIASSLLFGDGSAAALITSDNHNSTGLTIDHFYSEVITKGKRDMAWELSSSGFLMTLSGYIPDLIEEDFKDLIVRAAKMQNIDVESISDWCIHPGGKKILQAIEKSLSLEKHELTDSYEILKDYGNLSSATILFVLKQIMEKKKSIPKLMAAAFGPGLTIETFTAHC